ncbi:hypothetical protein VD0002_g7570 [Verticillium dahliae]|uniref:Uncharacterized protein n=1 Tax=Verticillium dahliae TaxID=27337 RepID=A0A2J8C254_VERDA|nr:hypothetical protein BJF96_g5474 [Verticillium dahliae]PNH53719.1 hypothetical protein VD0003_g3691 [Verticillium dahliae]PNH60016.1 hypothetical protein VD0002_g7570 [Verticillium dahliae]PNH77499.1 hypothetical protein VD0001_g25 [Verticillium dahliae]RBQ99838.1 hypothetical protein VDGD_08138 [Verticillium dahliae]
MKPSLLLLAAASGVLGSLNCTTTGPLISYCCPNTNSESVKTSPVGALIMLGCAADRTNKNWYWNWNGLYTPYTTQLRDCYLGNMAFNDLKVLPDCIDDQFVLDYTRGRSGPLDACNPNCVSQNKFPPDVYYGDKQTGHNMAVDFPRPGAPPGPAPGPGPGPSPGVPPTIPPGVPPTVPPPGGSCAGLWGQCGGQGWNGAKCCSQGTCRAQNQWYSQCVN